MNQITLLIVDDHPIVLEGLKAMFEFRPKFSVAAALPSAEDAVKWIKENGEVDVVLSDVRMPGMTGFDLVEELGKSHPNVKVVLLSGTPLMDERKKARELGAAGYFAKTANTATLADAVRSLAECSEEFLSEDYTPSRTDLTLKEEETLRYMALGKTREEIAIITACSPETVKNRMTVIRQKLDAPNAASAISRAYELGILRA